LLGELISLFEKEPKKKTGCYSNQISASRPEEKALKE